MRFIHFRIGLHHHALIQEPVNIQSIYLYFTLYRTTLDRWMALLLVLVTENDEVDPKINKLYMYSNYICAVLFEDNLQNITSL